MIRKEAMQIVLDEIKNEPIISANGYISRDLFELKEKNTNFYIPVPILFCVRDTPIEEIVNYGISATSRSRKVDSPHPDLSA